MLWLPIYHTLQLYTKLMCACMAWHDMFVSASTNSIQKWPLFIRFPIHKVHENTPSFHKKEKSNNFRMESYSTVQCACVHDMRTFFDNTVVVTTAFDPCTPFFSMHLLSSFSYYKHISTTCFLDWKDRGCPWRVPNI